MKHLRFILLILSLLLQACLAVPASQKHVVTQNEPVVSEQGEYFDEPLQPGLTIDQVRQAYPSMRYSNASHSFIRLGEMDTAIAGLSMHVTTTFNYKGEIDGVAWTTSASGYKESFYKFVQAITPAYGAQEHITETLAIWGDSSYVGMRVASLESGSIGLKYIGHSDYSSSNYYGSYKPKRGRSRSTNPLTSSGSTINKARPPVSTGGSVQVKGYYRKDGTYVRPHTRKKK